MEALTVKQLDGDLAQIDAPDLDALIEGLQGVVLLPGSPDFDAAVSIWNASISAIPSLVVQATSVDDVRRVIDFARTRDLLLSIKGGGCHVAGTSLADGGLTLDMSRMKAVLIDEDRRVVQVGPGCLIGDVEPVTRRRGVASVFGYDSQTGIAGSSLGGGFGYLTRRFGCGLDNITELEIVTADGRVRRAADDENEDLFWALRGGDGNFGVVTRFTFRAHEMPSAITGGLIIWDAGQTDEVISVYRDLAESAPREMTLTLIMRRAPAVPFVPEQWHGKPVIGVLACHIGNIAQAEQDLKRLRHAGRPIADSIVQRTYADQQALLGHIQPPQRMHQYWKSEFLPSLTDEMLAAFASHGSDMVSPTSQAILFHLGGALMDVPVEATAFAHRDAAYSFIGAGSWPIGATNADQHRAWVLSEWEAIRRFSTGGNYINVQTADEGETRIEEAYGENFDRLTRVKGAWDPDNVFRVNRNIPPGSRGSEEPAPEGAGP